METKSACYDPLLELNVKNYYDIQKAMLAAGQRKDKVNQVLKLSERDKELMAAMQQGLDNILRPLLKRIEKTVHKHPLWKEYIEDIGGVGEGVTGIILTNIDIERATTVSKMFSVCGLGFERLYSVSYRQIHFKKDGSVHKTSDNKHGEFWATSEQSARNCIPRARKIGNVPVNTRTEMLSCTLLPNEPQRQRMHGGQYPTYNNFLKAKLLGVMATSIVKYGGRKHKKKDTRFVEMYYNFKQRIAQQCPDDSDGYIDRKAKRKMVKEFIKGVYANWRRIEGLPVRPPYEEEYLGKVHSA